VPVGDCSGVQQGRSDLPVLGLVCVFLLQDVNQSGNGGQVFGEILSNCQVNGTPGPAPNNSAGPYRIQLYHLDGRPQSEAFVHPQLYNHAPGNVAPPWPNS